MDFEFCFSLRSILRLGVFRVSFRCLCFCLGSGDVLEVFK